VTGGIAILVASLALVAGGASGATHPAWLSPAVLAPPGAGDARGPRVAVDAYGDVTVVWAARHASDQGVVETASRPAGGAFDMKHSISPSGLWSGPDLGVDAAGDATVVWSAGPDYRHQVVQSAFRPAGGSFGAPADLTAPGTVGPRSPRIAVDARGDAVAMWLADEDSGRTLRVSFRAAGASFGAPQDLFTATGAENIDNFYFDVAMAPNGAAVAVWTGSTDVWAAYRPRDGGFGKPELLTHAVATPAVPFPYVDAAHVAIDASGDAVAAWWNSGRIEAAFRPSGGTWQPTRTVAEAADCCGFGRPVVALDGKGNAVAVWVGPDATIQTATRLARSESWGSAETISRAGDRAFVEPPSIATSVGGDIVVAWAADRAAGAVVAARRPSGGSFESAVDVWQGPGFTEEPPQVAIDPNGNAAAAWRTVPSLLPRDSRSGWIQAAGYDDSGPQLRALRIPATGRVGARLRFSVSPLDVWSNVSSTRWSFGRAAHAMGPRVSHVFRHLGRVRVTVRSVDGLGNATSATRRLRIVR
jgi:hypothetical protein